MSDDFTGFSEWTPSGENLEGLEDRDFDFSVADVESASAPEYPGPCYGCTSCAMGGHPIGAGFESRESISDIVEIQFKSNRSGFYLNETGIYLEVDSRVIVEVEHGIDLGLVAATGDIVHQKRRSRGIVGQPMGKILRVANDEDLKQLADNDRTEQKAASIFKEKCAKYNLQMKLTAVEYQFDRSRITFYFTADKRVDFRSFVRDLAGIYHTRIELRQIGARDDAKKVGGVGICGREICCISWMTHLRKVNVDYAKYQNLSLNQSRLAGSCGRLKCCILFENPNYLEALEKFPLVETKMVTSKGDCIVERVDFFNDRIFLKYQDTGIVESIGLDELKSYMTSRNTSPNERQIQNH